MPAAYIIDPYETNSVTVSYCKKTRSVFTRGTYRIQECCRSCNSIKEFPQTNIAEHTVGCYHLCCSEWCTLNIAVCSQSQQIFFNIQNSKSHCQIFLDRYIVFNPCSCCIVECKSCKSPCPGNLLNSRPI